MTHIFYHSNCYDGFGAAFSAWKHLGDDASYHSVSYGGKLPELESCDILYILDFSYDEEVLVDLNDKYNCQIVLIDHHITAQKKLQPLTSKYDWLDVHFDMSRSGALMSWEYFFPDKEVPMLIKHISDRDLWKFEMEGSKEVHKSLVSHPMDFKLWDSFDVEDLKKDGVALERMYNTLVDNICKNPFTCNIAGTDVPCVNTSIAWSEVGQKLLSMHPDAEFVASFTVFGDSVMWSLRSKGDFDVSKVAEIFGGGGHAQAAGFKTLKLEDEMIGSQK